MSLLLSVTIISCLSGQGWFDGSPSWDFSFGSCFDLVNGYDRMFYRGDTIVDGQEMKKFSRQHFSNSYGDIVMWDRLILMYEQDDKVYHYYDSVSHLLYDFTYEQGDTIEVEIYDTRYCDSMLYVVLDTIEYRMIGDEKLRAQIWRPSPFLENISSETVIVEKIGTTSQHFLTGSSFDNNNCYLDACPLHYFRCYYNESFGSFPGTCDDLILSDNTHDIIGLSVFPNPTTGQVRIDTDQRIKSVSVYDQFGRLQQRSTAEELSVSELPAAVYFVQVQFQDDRLGFSRLVKE